MSSEQIVKTVLHKLGVVAVKEIEMPDRLVAACGKDHADALLDTIYKRGDEGTESTDKTFYNMKNTTLQGSLVLSSSFEYDYFMQLLTAIKSHPDVIGKTVLDVGCDCGIISCAIAMLFPKAEVVGIDRCRNAISCAEELAKKNKINNVRFVKSDVFSFESGPFDTVISSKVAHELIDMQIIEFGKADLFEYAETFSARCDAYANRIASLCAENGILLSVERFGSHPHGLGYLTALQRAGFSFVTNDWQKVQNNSRTTDCGKHELFPIYFCIKAKDTDEDSAFIAFVNLCSISGLDFSLPQYGGWEALILFETRKGDLIFGYDLLKGGQQYGEVSIWTHNTDPTCILQKQVFGDVVHCYFLDVSFKQDIIDDIRTNLDLICNNYGVEAKEKEI